MTSQEYRVNDVNNMAEKLITEGHPEQETIIRRKEVYNKLLNDRNVRLNS